MIKLDIYTRYSSLGASSRLRYYLYEDAFKKSGFTAKIYPLFKDNYLKRLYKTSKKSKVYALLALIKRVLSLPFRQCDNLLIEYELFPNISYDIEKKFLHKKKYVLNFDDNVWEKYKNSKTLSNKYDLLVKNASGVIVANDMLAEKVSLLNKNYIKIPTVLNLEKYQNNNFKKFERFTLVWIGTPVTYQYIENFAKTLQQMAKEVDFDLLIIAKKSLKSRAIDNVNMQFVDWNEDLESELLMKSHVGIMPLPANDDFAKGKSAFKLIQYQAASLPSIASPIGENNKVISNGVNGFLPNNTIEWIESIKKLQSSNLYKQMSSNAKLNSENYSYLNYTKNYSDFLKKCF